MNWEPIIIGLLVGIMGVAIFPKFTWRVIIFMVVFLMYHFYVHGY